MELITGSTPATPRATRPAPRAGGAAPDPAVQLDRAPATRMAWRPSSRSSGSAASAAAAARAVPAALSAGPTAAGARARRPLDPRRVHAPEPFRKHKAGNEPAAHAEAAQVTICRSGKLGPRVHAQSSFKKRNWPD